MRNVLWMSALVISYLRKIVCFSRMVESEPCCNELRDSYQTRRRVKKLDCERKNGIYKMKSKNLIY